MMLTMDTNLKAGNATAQYTNFNFNSFANFNGKQLGVTDEGIFELDGDNDEGVNIDAYFEPVVTNFGYLHNKRMRFLYVGLRSDGQMQMKISVDGGDFVELPALPSTDMNPDRRKQSVPRTINGVYWKYQIANVAGSDFSFDSLSGIFTFRSAGIST